MLKKHTREAALYSYRSKERLATYATQEVECRAADFVDAARGEAKVSWAIDGGPRQEGATLKIRFRSPGTYNITAYRNQRGFNKRIAVGIDPAHMIRHPDL